MGEWRGKNKKSKEPAPVRENNYSYVVQLYTSGTGIYQREASALLKLSAI